MSESECRGEYESCGPIRTVSTIPCGPASKTTSREVRYPDSVRIAVVVPTASVEQPLARACLARVEATTADLDVSVHPVESAGPAFSFSRSVNEGLEATEDADAWVLLNDDCLMDPGWLHAMLDLVDRHPEVGAVGAVLRFPDGLPQHAGGWIGLTTLEVFLLAARQRRLLDTLPPLLGRRPTSWPFLFGHYRRVGPRNRLDFLTGACLLLTRRCRDRVGTFDEAYPLSAEDVDYCLRTRRADLELGLATAATGIHAEGSTSGHLQARKEAGVRRFRKRWTRDEVWDLTRTRRGVLHPLACDHEPSPAPSGPG